MGREGAILPALQRQGYKIACILVSVAVGLVQGFVLGGLPDAKGSTPFVARNLAQTRIGGYNANCTSEQESQYYRV